MLQQLRACIYLLIATVLLCVVVYPLILFGLGRTVFRSQAEGSMLVKDGQVVGSRLIAQPFKTDEYFQPRPSAAGPNGYDASASGASNWGANNPLLRDRVAQALGPIVKYASGPKRGQPASKDVEEWFEAVAKDDAKADVEKRFLPQWASAHSTLAEQWIKNNAAAVGDWLGKDEDTVKSESGALVKTFFKDYAAKNPGAWPSVVDKAKDGKTVKQLEPATKGSDVQASLFDPWLQAHPAEAAQLERVPADLVMASGSGLDPHITLANARYQLDRVAGAWAATTKRDKDEVRRDIDKLLNDKKEAPLGGLVGVPLVNVLEVNLALEARLRPQVRAQR